MTNTSPLASMATPVATSFGAGPAEPPMYVPHTSAPSVVKQATNPSVTLSISVS